MPMLLPGTRITIAMVAIKIVTISDPALAIQAHFQPPQLIESFPANDAQLSHEATCDLNKTCSATFPTTFLASSEKGEASLLQTSEALGHLDQRTKDQLLDLVRALRGGNPQTRKDAARALGRFGEAAGHAMPALLEAAGDSRLDVRANAVWAIGKVVSQEQTADAVNALTIALDDPSDHVRWNAAWSLARIGPAAEAAVPALIERLKDPAQKIRASAISALTKVASQSDHDVVIPALFSLKDDDEKVIRLRAATALRTLKSASEAPLKP